MLGSLQEVSLLLQYTDDNEHLFVMDLVVPFHWRQEFAVESHRVVRATEGDSRRFLS